MTTVSETNTYRFNVTVEIDVTNAETESEAREKAFAVMSTIPVARGRKASGPKAAITGVSIKPHAPLNSAQLAPLVPWQTTAVSHDFTATTNIIE
jgi:hypothetical protein